MAATYVHVFFLNMLDGFYVIKDRPELVLFEELYFFLLVVDADGVPLESEACFESATVQ